MSEIPFQLRHLPDQTEALKLPGSRQRLSSKQRETVENYTTVVNESKQSYVLHHEIVSISLLPIFSK